MKQRTVSLDTPTKIAHDLFWLLLFVVFPLSLDPAAFAVGLPYERSLLMPKAFVLAVSWTVGVLALLLSYRDRIPSKTFVRRLRDMPLALTAMLALVVFLLLDVWWVPGSLAVNLIGSFRVDGFLIQAIWYSLALIAAGLVYVRPENTRRAIVYLVIGALLSALWTLAQAYNVEPLALFYADAVNYEGAIGPLGLTALSAAYLSVSLTVLIAVQRRFDILVALIAGVLFTAVMATANRTAPAALLLALFALGVAYLLCRHYQRVGMLVLYSVIALASLGMLQITQSGGLQQLERTDKLLRGGDASFQVRLVFWQAGLRGMFDRPITGSGMNGFSEAFWRHLSREQQLSIVERRLPAEAKNITLTGGPVVFYRLPGSEEVSSLTFLIDRAHNYLIDMVVISGFPSAMLLLLAVGAGVVTMLKSEQREARAIALATCVYILFGLTWFATLQVDPIVWGLFGVGIGAAWAERTAELSDTLPIQGGVG